MKAGEKRDWTVLLVQVVVLLLQSTDLVHVNRVELTLGILLIGRELFLVHGLEAHSGIVADTDNKHPSAPGATLLILLVRKGYVNLRNVVGRVRRGIGIGEHGLTITTDDKDAGSAIVLRLDCESTVILGIVVCGKNLALSAQKLLAASSAEDEKDGDEDEGEEDKSEDRQHKVNHVVGAVVIIVGSPKDVAKRIHGGTLI